MLKKLILALPFLILAFFILFISVLRVASVKFEFAGDRPKNVLLGDNDIKIDYFLAYPGRILPDSLLWPVKALRDKIWYAITTNSGKKAELLLLFADKRLGSSLILFQKDNAEVGFSILSKAEKYLESASDKEVENRKKNIDTNEFLQRLINASLKHFQIIKEIENIAPEDARPKIIELEVYPKKVYENARNAILDKGMPSPDNPFDWE